MARTVARAGQTSTTPTITPRHRLVDEVYDAIKQMIVSNNLRGGEVISVSALADTLGVSRQPVSQAIVTLEQDGFVETEPFKAPRVSRITTKFIRDVYGVRNALETQAASEAIAHLDDSDRNDLRSGYEELTGGSQPPSDEAIRSFDTQLHRLLVERADNEILREYMANLEHHLTRIRNVYGQHVYSHDETESQFGELGGIVEGIVANDATAVELAMRNHIIHHADRLISRVSDDQA